MTEPDQNETPATVEEPWIQEVRGFLRRGRKIEAIKIYRTHVPSSLKEAKEAVERFEATGTLPVPAVEGGAAGQPSPRGAVQSKSGCAGVLLLGILIPLLAAAGLVAAVVAER